MERQSNAERLRRAEVLESEGYRQRHINESEGDRQSAINKAQGEAKIGLQWGEMETKLCVLLQLFGLFVWKTYSNIRFKSSGELF